MRWIQKVNPDGTSRFEPRDESARALDSGHAIHANNMDAFISPVDGSLVRNKREYDDHNKRNNVVNAKEFTDEFYAGKAKERADYHEGRHSKEETYARRCEVNEIINSLERKG